jgi:uncharacterized membrane protein
MDQDLARQRYERIHDPKRLIALSDGVFAIVLTLMVLEIHVPELTDASKLQTALDEIRPSFVAFVISFAIVGISWMAHRDLFSMLRLTDRNLVWLNTLYLLPLSMVPFGAALLAHYDQQKVALVLYGVLVVALALTRLVIWLYATNRPHLLFEPVDARSRLMGVVMVLVPLAMYVAAIWFAGSHPTVSVCLYAAVPVLYFVSAVVIRSSAPPGTAESEFT